jgi:hypothetical protein
MSDRRFIKEEGSFTTLSQTGEPTTVHRSTEWIESKTFGGTFVTKVGTLYQLVNGEPVIKVSDTEFSCPSSGLILHTEEPVEQRD